jgi:putative chitinase
LSVSIAESVGFGGHNNPIDVAVIQHLISKYFTQRHKVKGRSTTSSNPSIPIDGVCTHALIDLIKKVQGTALGMKSPDGRVDPNGKTFRELILRTNPIAATAKELLFGFSAGNTGLLTKVNAQRFRKLVIKQSGLGLTITKGEDLLVFFNFLQNDPDIQEIRWAAYILATVYKESEFSFKPKEENGKGGNLGYAKPQQVTDVLGCRGPKNAVYTNSYYGRGYVQITHAANYKALGKAYGIGDELYINPDRALEPQIAYFITSYGMRHGTFTAGRHKLSMHINGKKCDYKGARQIINGHDKDVLIAEYANKVEILLRLSP